MNAMPDCTETDTRALIWRALKWCELFSKWPDEHLHALRPSARLARYPKRSLVMSHGTQCRELLCVVSGCLEVSSVNADGGKYLNAVVGPGTTVPVIRLLADEPLTFSYYSVLDSTVLHLPVEAVIAQLNAHPMLWRDLAELALRRQRNSMALLQKQLLTNNRQRLASTLLELAQVYGRGPGRSAREVSINQTDLANMVGVTRQTVNKELKAFTELGILDIAYGRICVRDLAKLREQCA